MNIFTKEKRKVRIHFTDGRTSIEGVLAGKTKDAYIVWAPKILTSSTETPEVAVSGHVEIPRPNVLFYQVIG